MGMKSTALKPVATERVETRYRRIVTPVPVPESIPIIERLRAVEPVSMSGMPPTLWQEAEGFAVRDPYGNQWIDFTSGILVANSGHSHPRVLDAIHQITLILLGKGLSSSVPVSAVIGPRWLMDLPVPGEMSTTHGGNPLCARASLANLEVIEEERLVEASARTGARVHSVHGRGLFITVHLNQPETGEPDIALADAVAEEAVRRGVMLFTTGRGCLKIAPPLSIELEAALEAVGVLRECVLALKDRRS